MPITLVERYDLSQPDATRVVETDPVLLKELIPPEVWESDAVCQVTVNEYDVDDDGLHHIYVGDGDRVTIRATPGIAIAAGASAAVVTGAALGKISAGAIIGSFLFKIGLQIALGFAVAAIQRAIAPKQRDRSVPEESPTYSFDTPRTTTENGAPIHLVFGEFQTGGQLLEVRSITEEGGNTSLIGLLIGLGEGGEHGFQEIAGFTQDTDESTDLIGIGNKILINDQPIETFTGIRVSVRMGTAHQAPIRSFANETVVKTFSTSDTLFEAIDGAFSTDTIGTPFVYTTTELNDRVKITINYDQVFSLARDGDIKPFNHKFRVEYKETSEAWGAANVVVKAMKGPTQTGSSMSFTIQNPDRKTLNIRFIDEQEEFIQTSLGLTRGRRFFYTANIQSIEEITDEVFAYPGRALIAVEAVASSRLRGSQFSVATNVKAVKMRVYTTTSSYSVAYSSNPAWVVLWLLTDKQAGLGQLFDIDQDVDIQSFIDAADFCDTQVEDGQGSLENLLEMDGAIDTREVAMQHLEELLINSRLILLRHSGKLILRAVDQRSPVHQFNPGNMSGFSSRYIDPFSIISFAVYQFRDRDDQFRLGMATGIDEDKINVDDFVFDSKQLVGVTRKTQAQRVADLVVQRAKVLIRACSWTTGVESIRCEPGDVVEVANKETAWGLIAGRVVSSTSGSVKIDQLATFQAAISYRIRIFHFDGTFEDFLVQNTPGTTDEITISGSWAANPAQHEMYSIGQVGDIIREIEILDIRRTGDMQATISGIEYADTLYANGVPTVANIESKPGFRSTDLPPDVSNLSVSEKTFIGNDGSVFSALEVYWSKPISPIFSHVDIWVGMKSYDDDDEEIESSDISFGNDPALGRFRGTYAELNVPLTAGKKYYVAVSACSTFGNCKQPEDAPQRGITIQGKDTLPEDVTNFTGIRSEDSLVFTWTDVGDLDFDFYEIRQGSSWGSAILVSRGIKVNRFETTQFFTDPANTISLTFLIKARDKSGNYSQNADSVTLSIDPKRNTNSKVSRDENNAGWPDTKTNMTVAGGGQLSLDSGETTGSYTTSEIDLGASERSHVAVRIETSQVGDDDPTWNAATFTWNSSEGQARTWNGLLGLEILDADVEIDFGDSTPLGGNWQPFIAGEYKFRYVRFRATLTVASVEFSADLDEMFIEISDLKKIVEVESETVTGSSDPYSVTYPEAFQDANTVSLTVILLDTNLAAGDYFEISNRTATGFDIRVKDSGGTVVTTDRDISYQAIGF